MNGLDGKVGERFRPELQQAFARLTAAERGLLRHLYGQPAEAAALVQVPLSSLEDLPALAGTTGGAEAVLGRLVGAKVRVPVRTGDPGDTGHFFFNWLSAAYVHADAYGRLVVSAWLNPSLSTWLREEAYGADAVAGMGVEQLQSPLAVRLLERCLAAWKEEAEPTEEQWVWRPDVGDLKAALGIGEMYRDFRNFRRKVLEPVCLEINARTRYRLEIGFRREGRQVVGVDLYLRREPAEVQARPLFAIDTRAGGPAGWNERISRLSDAGIEALHLLLSRGVPVRVAFQTVFPYTGGSEVKGYEQVFVQQLLLLFDQGKEPREPDETDAEQLVQWLLTLPVEKPAVRARLTERLVAHKKRVLSGKQ